MYEVTKIVKFIASRIGMVVFRDWRRERNGELLITGHKVSVKQDEYVLVTLY